MNFLPPNERYYDKLFDAIEARGGHIEIHRIATKNKKFYLKIVLRKERKILASITQFKSESIEELSRVLLEKNKWICQE